MSRYWLSRVRPNVINELPDFPIVYTPVHGTGITQIPQVLRLAGFTNVSIVTNQQTPDGSFPTVESPNPEEGACFAEGIRLAREVNAPLVLATDPDENC